MSPTTIGRKKRENIQPKLDEAKLLNESLIREIQVIDNEIEMAKRQLRQTIRNEPHKFLCREQAQQEKIKEFLGKNPLFFKPNLHIYLNYF